MPDSNITLKLFMKSIAFKKDIPECYHCLYIDYGYRHNYSVWDAVWSMFSFHNETMNIWSHFIGLLCVAAIGIDFLIEYYYNSTSIEIGEFISLQIYFSCAAFCLFFSTIYHLFNCVSERCHDDLLRIDLTGVALLVTGSFIPGVYFGFHCVPNIRDVHLFLTAFVLLVGLIAPWITIKIRNRFVRPYILASLVVFGLVPCVHWALITPQIYIDKLYLGVLLMFFWYAVGFAIFTTRYPEKAFPKSFIATQVMSSHTLWHICVLLAIYVWYVHIIKYEKLLDEIGCQPYEDLSYTKLIQKLSKIKSDNDL